MSKSLINGTDSHQQPVLITWTTSPKDKQPTDHIHIKQEDELNIITQVIQQVPVPEAVKSIISTKSQSNYKVTPKEVSQQIKNSKKLEKKTAGSEKVSIAKESEKITTGTKNTSNTKEVEKSTGSKKYVKIVPKNGNEEISQEMKEKYLKVPKRRHAKRHFKTPEEWIEELKAEGYEYSDDEEEEVNGKTTGYLSFKTHLIP